MFLAIKNFFRTKIPSFFADWLWKVIGFEAWHVVMDAAGNLGLLID